jgi:ammonium transporter Rh
LLFSAVFIPFFSLNHWIGYHLLHAFDLGGSIYIFTFGSFFGLLFSLSKIGKKNMIINLKLAFSKRDEDEKDADDKVSRYDSDLLSIFGTIFLWILWPSFNAALAPDTTQHRTIINTVLALCTSVIFTFLTSRTLRGGKFSISDIQRASIVGGIALASVTSYLVSAGAAMVTGAVAGLVSTVSLVHLQPLLHRKLSLQDSLSSVSVYLIPGVIGALAGILAAAVASDYETIYGVPLETLFPNHDSRQAGWNLLILVITLGIAGASGLIFGFIFRFVTRRANYFYSDDADWEVPSDFEGHVEIHSEADEDKKKRKN